jgi:hypothetical protein
MARLSKLRKALTGTFLALVLGLLVAACEVSPAASLGLPALSAEVGAISVKTPTVTVTTPSVPVKSPTATAPTTPVNTPRDSPKTPTVPVKTTPAKAPSVKVKLPSSSGQGPTASAPVPSTSSLGEAAAPGAKLTTTNASSPPRNLTGTAPAPSSASVSPANGVSSAAPSGQATPVDGTAGYGAGPAVESPVGGVGTRQNSGERARMADDSSLVETVARLQGCLSELPKSHRRALMLRTGVGSSQALSARAAAARLHLDAARFARVERQALGELQKAARSSTCGQMEEIATAVVAFVGPDASGGGPTARSGVEAARYAFSPPPRHAIKPAGSSSGSLLGDISPTASSAIVVLLLLVAAAIAAGIVVTHGSGNSPRWRYWRRRVADGLRRMR